MKAKSQLTDADYTQLDLFLNTVLTDYKHEVITLEQVQGSTDACIRSA